MTRRAFWRSWVASVAACAVVGCGSTVSLDKQDQGASGRVRSPISGVSAPSGVLSTTMDTDTMYAYVAYVHGFTERGLNEGQISDAVDYVDAARNNEPTGNHPGIATFNVSCALCHNSIDTIGDTRDGSMGIEGEQNFFAVGP